MRASVMESPAIQPGHGILELSAGIMALVQTGAAIVKAGDMEMALIAAMNQGSMSARPTRPIQVSATAWDIAVSGVVMKRVAISIGKVSTKRIPNLQRER